MLPTDKNKSAAVHIPVEHQSAPKEHWADKVMVKAAEEIANGQFVPTKDEDDDFAIGLTRGLGIKSPVAQNAQERAAAIRETEYSLALAQHPRVQEALQKLALEKRDAKTSQELAEKAQMLHELNAKAAMGNQWDGQGRWIGRENEEMRVVNLMTPMSFHAKLESVIGEKRVYLNRFAVMHRAALLVENAAAKNTLLWTPERAAAADDDKFLQVGTLQYPVGPEWMVMRFDEYGVPTTAKYLGWRTALLSMIDLRVITEKEAHKAFPLVDGPASLWYREQLQDFRSRDGVVN